MIGVTVVAHRLPFQEVPLVHEAVAVLVSRVVIPSIRVKVFEP